MTQATSYYLTDLIGVAEQVLAASAQVYVAALQTEASDKAAAFRDKSGMPDGYWKPTHVARMRYEAAAALYAAVVEASRSPS